MSSESRHSRATKERALEGQADTHAPQRTQDASSMKTPSSRGRFAPVGQAARQLRQPMHLRASHHTRWVKAMPSGLWHHRQARGQPLKKTVERRTRPSCVVPR